MERETEIYLINRIKKLEHEVEHYADMVLEHDILSTQLDDANETIKDLEEELDKIEKERFKLMRKVELLENNNMKVSEE